MGLTSPGHVHDSTHLAVRNALMQARRLNEEALATATRTCDRHRVADCAFCDTFWFARLSVKSRVGAVAPGTPRARTATGRCGRTPRPRSPSTVAMFSGSASCVLLTATPIFFVLCRTLAPEHVPITEYTSCELVDASAARGVKACRARRAAAACHAHSVEGANGRDSVSGWAQRPGAARCEGTRSFRTE